MGNVWWHIYSRGLCTGELAGLFIERMSHGKNRPISQGPMSGIVTWINCHTSSTVFTSKEQANNLLHDWERKKSDMEQRRASTRKLLLKKNVNSYARASCINDINIYTKKIEQYKSMIEKATKWLQNRKTETGACVCSRCMKPVLSHNVFSETV